MSLNHVDPILMCVRGWKILVRKLEELGQGTRAGTQFTHASLPNDWTDCVKFTARSILLQKIDDHAVEPKTY